MLAIRHYPRLATPDLWKWCQSFVKYDDDGRCSRWLADSPVLPNPLAEVAEDIATGVEFSGVLLQAYRDGNAVTPCHTDAGGTGWGFILSLGATRTLRFHPMGVRCDDELNAIRIECIHGTCISMSATFHAGWHHQIVPDPGMMGAMGEKLSLVFRTKPGGA